MYCNFMQCMENGAIYEEKNEHEWTVVNTHESQTTYDVNILRYHFPFAIVVVCS